MSDSDADVPPAQWTLLPSLAVRPLHLLVSFTLFVGSGTLAAAAAVVTTCRSSSVLLVERCGVNTASALSVRNPKLS